MRGLEGWMMGYLINALWQVPVLFAAAWLVVRLVRRVGVRTSARMEHRVWVLALVLEVVVPACQFSVVGALRAVSRLVMGGGGTAGGEVRVAVEAGAARGAEAMRLPAPVLLGVAVVFGCSLVYFAGRLAWGILQTVRMQREAERVSLPAEIAGIWVRCRSRFELKMPEMAVSAMVSGPVTVGRELMLVPPGFLDRVAEGDLEAVIAHEFAHMRRRDFVKNLVYEALSLPMMWHPVVWMTRSRVAESREMVCDAMAAEAVAGRGVYARSLLRLASLVVQARPVRTYHAIGLFDANLFERRVMSLTEKRVEVRGLRRLGLFAACAVIGLGTCASALALRMEVAAPAVKGASVDGKKPVKVSVDVMTNLTKVVPVYPPDAKEKRISGAVILHAVIGKEGAIENLQVVSGPEELQRSALDAVRQWTYKPYLLNGEPTEVDTTIEVTYSFDR